MSLFQNNKLSLITLTILAIFIIPKIASATDFNLDKKTWTINPEVMDQTDKIFITNDFDLRKIALQTLTGIPYYARGLLYSTETLQQIEKTKTDVEQTAEDAILNIEGNTVTAFNPGQNGQTLDTYALLALLQLKLADLPVVASFAKVPLGATNDLGIKELVAVGESNFTGSSHNRTTNITVGSAKYNGVIINPGQEFSFNSYLGDIDAAHGFLPELVIKREGVVPEFGGGLCQVSTTMFRAAMNAGLPITARRNHSFAVHYYSPQGTDATIYPGASDLKFVNNYDTPLIIHTKIDAGHLYFEFYGAKDARVVKFDGPYQYDRQSDGSMKAIWTRIVTINGQDTTQVFKSTYVSPSLFEKVTTVAPATPNPQ